MKFINLKNRNKMESGVFQNIIQQKKDEDVSSFISNIQSSVD
jgi:hypothetical protein